MNSNISSQNRITVIDALRGFTLLGILIVHTKTLWGFPQPNTMNTGLLAYLNGGLNWIIDTFFVSKFNTIFNLLFGVSFYIQLHRAESKGIDFRWRFIWRMVILIFIGYLHELIFTWEALLLYGIVGIPLVLFYKFNSKWILILGIVCLVIHPFYNIAFEYSKTKSQPLTEARVNLQENSKTSYKAKFATAKNFFKYNFKKSTKERLSGIKANGPFRTLGIFLFGLFLAKINFFENIAHKKQLYKRIFWASLFGYLMLWLISWIVDVPKPMNAYADYMFASIILSGFILLYTTQFHKLLDYLIPYGKMGLTNYILQSVYGLLIFAPFCLGLNNMNILGREVISVIFYAIQVLLCTLWLKYFLYGPFEWFWRSATYMKIMPFKKK